MDATRQSVNAGTAWTFPLGPGDLLAAFDLRDLMSRRTTGFAGKTHFGTTYLMPENWGVSAGFNKGYFTTGAHKNWEHFRMGVGYYADEAGDEPGDRPDQRYFLKLAGDV